MDVFHYVAEQLKDEPLFENDVEPEVNVGAVYNDFDAAPMSLLLSHKECSEFSFSQSVRVTSSPNRTAEVIRDTLDSVVMAEDRHVGVLYEDLVWETPYFDNESETCTDPYIAKVHHMATDWNGCWSAITVTEKAVSMFQRRFRTAWDCPDSVYDAWLLRRGMERPWFDMHRYNIMFPDASQEIPCGQPSPKRKRRMRQQAIISDESDDDNGDSSGSSDSSDSSDNEDSGDSSDNDDNDDIQIASEYEDEASEYEDEASGYEDDEAAEVSEYDTVEASEDETVEEAEEEGKKTETAEEEAVEEAAEEAEEEGKKTETAEEEAAEEATEEGKKTETAEEGPHDDGEKEAGNISDGSSKRHRPSDQDDVISDDGGDGGADEAFPVTQKDPMGAGADVDGCSSDSDSNDDESLASRQVKFRIQKKAAKEGTSSR